MGRESVEPRKSRNAQEQTSETDDYKRYEKFCKGSFLTRHSEVVGMLTRMTVAALHNQSCGRGLFSRGVVEMMGMPQDD